MKSKRISSFTPSNTDPEVLERVFVQRQELLGMLVRQLEHSMSTGDKSHFLLIGPRGSGKTHLLTLAHFRLEHTPALADSMRIAWLGEDTVITGLVDLALEMTSQLAVAYPDEFDPEFPATVRSLPPDEAAEAILHHLVGQLGDRNLLLMMENLDRAFDGLGDDGQKKWRAFLQETGKIATLATSQQLFEGIASRKEAFFGFFDIHYLDPLSVEHAQRLIANVAREYQNHDLATFLGTNEGRYRVRALRHLAGGNHRMYILLSEFLTKESLDDLVSAFEQLAEELTPYFQERIRSLSPQQARIVQCLCNADGALTVKAIAEETFIAERNCSKQLGELKKKCYVRSERRGKEAYYEMAEPLMRLCLEIKNQRGRPLRLIALFLRAWFPLEALQTTAPETRASQYRAYALTLDRGFETEVQRELSREFKERMDHGDFDGALPLTDEMHYANPVLGRLQRAIVEFGKGQLESALADLGAVIGMPDVPAEHRARALINHAMIHGRLGQAELALADYTTVIDMPDVLAEDRAWALLCRGAAYGEQGQTEPELADYTAVIGMPDAPAEGRAWALFNRGYARGDQGQAELALADYTAVIDMLEASTEPRVRALVNRGMTRGRQGHLELESADYTVVIDMPDAPVEYRARALLNRGLRYAVGGHAELALADLAAVLDMPDAPAEDRAGALLGCALSHREQGQVELALADYTAVLDMPDAPAEPRARALVNRGVTYGERGQLGLELADYTAVIGMPDAPTEQRALALANRGVTYGEEGQTELELADYTTVIDMPDAPAEQRTKAMFLLPEAMIPLRSRSEAMGALLRAFKEGETTLDFYYGGRPDYLLKAILRKGHSEWPAYVSDLVPLYANHGVCAKLGNGLTRSIKSLAEGDFSATQLDAWNRAWQEAGRDIKELEIPLRSLDCAIRAIKEKSDRPLFDLPLEIRELVAPLLGSIFGPKQDT